MKIPVDKKLLKICLYVFITAAALLIFYRLLAASMNLWQSAVASMKFIGTLLSPFVTAVVIAYILNPAVNVTEKGLEKIIRQRTYRAARTRRVLALSLVYTILLALAAVSIFLVVPSVVQNLGEMIRMLPHYYDVSKTFVMDTLTRYHVMENDAIRTALETKWQELQDNLFSYLSTALGGIADTLMNITTTIVGIVGQVMSFILGLVLSFYLINEKDTIREDFEKLLTARFGVARTFSTMKFLAMVDRVFGQYISGKLLESLFLYVMVQITFGLMGVPFNALMSVIVAVTNIVPYIGPVIGSIPPILVALINDPTQALYVTIALIVLQAIDGYVLVPLLIGDRTGLSPFWVLFSTIVLGGLFGLWGVILAVPIAAVLALLIKGYIYRREQIRKAKQKLQNPEEE